MDLMMSFLGILQHGFNVVKSWYPATWIWWCQVFISRFPDQPTAADVINHLDVKELSLILKEYGEEKRAKEIAQAIIEARYAFGNISRTLQLAKIVDAVFEG